METIVYSKYSNERAARFQIRTDIVKRADGTKYVRKSACTQEAKAHIADVYRLGQQLDKTYRDTKLCVNKASMEKEAVCFEFLQGQTFEEYLDGFLKKNDYTAIVSEIQKLFDMLKQTGEMKNFRVTEQFREIYGDIAFPVVLQALDFNNIDYIFGNIYMQEKQWTIIDYEWTFDFPIPFLYIVYRAIHYYTYDKSREGLAELGVMRMFGITRELESCFELMEHRFQKYILGEITPVINMYSHIAGTAYEFDHMLLAAKESSRKNRIQVFYDYGQGFSEENSQYFYPETVDSQDGYCSYRIQTGQAKSLRIDPADRCCMVKLQYIRGKGTAYRQMEFASNGHLMENEAYVFATEDPMFVLPALDGSVTEITIVLRVEVLSEETALSLIDMKDKLTDSTKQEKELAKTVGALQQNYADAMQHIDNITRDYESRLNQPPLWKRAIKKIVKSNKITHKLARGLKCLKENGLSYTYQHTKKKIKRKLHPDQNTDNWKISAKEIQEQKNTVFSKKVLFSVIVPLYNTPEKFLREMIESVQKQTYPGWELCMADGSDAEHAYVEKICRKYAKKDARIKYRKLEQNEGISENTNRCLEMAQGNYIALFDHDDLLHPSALYENMCVIEREDADFIYSDEDTFSKTPKEAYCPHYKPDFSPDTLRSYNYICHFSVFKRSLLDQVGTFRKEFDGSQDYDMILRLTEKAKVIVHIPKIIYFWRAHQASVASNISAKTYCLDAARKALAEHLQRIGLKGEVLDASIPSVYRMKYDIEGEPLVSILIPNKDYIEDLSKCINSILEKSTYRNFEIIVIENNSTDEETFRYYKELEQKDKVRVVYWEGEFNYSAINNFGFRHSKGDYVLLLNNDIEVITPDWLQEMLMFAQRSDVGAVGAKLYYPDDTVQHAGIIVGIGGVAGHSHKGYAKDAYGYSSRLQLAQNLSAVTAACMLLPRKVYEEVEGLDEGYKVAFNDVDLCMKIRQAGYLIVFTPFAELYHYESKSRGYENTPEKVERFNGEIKRFYSKWDPVLEKGDPYYNPNLTLISEDFAIKKPDEKPVRA